MIVQIEPQIAKHTLPEHLACLELNNSVQISGSVLTNNLTNLANSINNYSGRTGVKANLSSDLKHIILENEDGDGTLITHLHHLQIRKKHVGDVFDLMDRDGDGRLTADEARANLTGDGSGHRTFALDEHVDVQVDGHLPELWGRVARRLA